MCDSDKEVEDIKTEENVENDEASTETEDCEKKDLPEEPQYEILDVEELQRNFREKVIDFFKVKSHIVVTSVSAAVIIAGVITGIVVGISVNKASKHQPAIVEAAETQTEMQTHTQPESTEPEEEESTEETFEVIDDIMEKVVTDSAVTQKEDPLKNRNNATAGEVIKPVLYVDNAVSGSVSVSSVKKSGTDVIYSLKGRKIQDFTASQLDKCSKDSILVEENGTQKQYTGYVYETGTVSVTGNTVTNSFEAASNLVLAKDGVINVSGAVTDSVIGVAVQEASAGRTVVKLDDAVTDVKLTDVLSQITYEGDSSLKIGEDGTLVSTTEPSPTPTPAEEKLKVTGKECKWSGSSTVKIKFQSNVKGTYYIDWVKRGEKAPTIDTSRVGAPIEADTNVTAKVTDLPDYDVDIYVCVISDKDKSNYGSVMFQPDSKERPVTPTPSHTPVVPDVKESVVQGFEKALVFYPKTFYDFKVIGAGTQNNNPGEGDVRWVPSGWSMSSNPSSWNPSWKIGAKDGIYTDTEKTYTIYIKYNKQVYSGNDWQETDASEVLSYQFKAAPLTQATTTPGANGTNGDGTGSGDGTTDGGTTDVTPTTYADGTNGTAKSAVSTGDESPIGTMLALAAASVLAGGYVLIRRRKKEM